MSYFFNNPEFGDPASFPAFPASPENLFNDIFDDLDGLLKEEDQKIRRRALLFQQDLSETDELDEPNKSKKAKITTTVLEEEDADDETRFAGEDGRRSHITVERNRRKQMNHHISVLRSLMPCFYVKRGDQASIIGGVVDYINELQQVLQSLKAKKQRKVYSEVLSPRIIASPRASPTILSPRKPPLSPRIINLPLPMSPRTPQPSSPYSNIRPRLNLPIELSPSSSSSSSHNNDCIINELIANSKSPMAEVEIKFSGPNLLLKTVSPRIPGQVVKIISVLQDLSLEILHISISTIGETMLNYFTIKIGIECQLSAEELAHQIQQTFCLNPLIN